MSIHLANLKLTPKQWPFIQQRAKKGDTEAMYLVGIAFLLGGLVNADSNKAYFWLEKSANKGHADAAFRCGFLIENQRVQKNETPTYWYTKGEELGSHASICALANQWTFEKLKRQRFWHKWWGGQDQSQEALVATTRYQKAIELNYGPAFYFQGIHTLKGWGQAKDIQKARDLLEKGLAEKDKDSAYALALTYPHNSMEYWKYLEQAADWGNPQAQYKFAIALLAKRQQFSTEQALSWLKKASIQRYGPALLLLSQSLAFGRGCPPDLPQAYKWAKRANQLGVIGASWPTRLYNKLDATQKEYADKDTGEDDQKFHELSQHLFGQPGLSS